MSQKMALMGGTREFCSVHLRFRNVVLMFVDGGVGVIVSPIEPVILERRDAGKALALRGAGDSAALEVPRTGCSRVDQLPLRGVPSGIALKKEFGVAAVDAADEGSKGFVIWTENDQQRRAVDAIDDGRLFHESVPWIGAGDTFDAEPDDYIARLKFGAGKADDNGKFGYVGFPIAVVFFGVLGYGRQDLARGKFGSPFTEGEVVSEHEFKRSALQRAVEGPACDL